MLHTRNVAKAENYRVRFFPQNNCIILIICTFSRFGESGLNRDWLGLGRGVFAFVGWQVILCDPI